MWQMAPADNVGRLYDAHASALFAFLLSLIRHEADCRDLLQEIFVKLARQPELLAAARDERAFLLRLAHNLAIDLMRRRQTRERNYQQLRIINRIIYILIQKYSSGCNPDRSLRDI